MIKKIIPFNVAIKSTYPVRSFDCPKVYTNDLNSVEIQFKVIDCTAEELETATATIQFFMRDGSFFQNPTTDFTRVGNVFSYTLKENEGNHGGLAKVQLVMIIGGTELASPLLEFEIINGLETKVATEVVIQDWTTLTREARAYIDQFVADEAIRQQQFDDAQTARTNIFTQSETDRTTAFEVAETLRQQKETERQEAESKRIEDEALRQAGYDADHGRAETDHIVAETDHATAVNDHAMVQGFNARLTAEETATANNKISAVKGKTFADVDARFEELETQSIAFDKEKANKVQEAWITPTLINGWKSFADSPVQYRKDGFGVVHFRGRLDPSAKASGEFCTLPAGYRPTANVYVNFAGSSYLAFTKTGSCQSFITVWQSLEMIKLHTT